jgi:hypothetical protein
MPCSSLLRRAERLILSSGNLIADDECHVLSAWVDSTRIALQAASGLSIQRLNSSTEARRETLLIPYEAET